MNILDWLRGKAFGFHQPRPMPEPKPKPEPKSPPGKLPKWSVHVRLWLLAVWLPGGSVKKTVLQDETLTFEAQTKSEARAALKRHVGLRKGHRSKHLRPGLPPGLKFQRVA